MDLLEKLENYILDLLLLDEIDPIFEERLASYELIHSYYDGISNTSHYKSIEFLLEAIKKKPLIDFRKSPFNDILRKIFDLLNKNLKLEKGFLENINNINAPEIFKYFFNKFIIAARIDEFNQVPVFETEIEDYPDRVYIENQFDLIEDIENLIDYISKFCFNNKIISFDNIVNKAVNYKYFFDLLIFNITLIKFTKEMYGDILTDIISIRKKIINAIEYNIPLKID